MSNKQQARAVLRCLERGKARIENKEHWTKGVFARSVKGYPIGPAEKNANQWCAIGSVRADMGRAPQAAGGAERALRNATKTALGPTYINDTRGHKAVMALYDRAIARFKKEYDL